MTLDENVSKQIAAGFSREEILDNLKTEPYSRQEILAVHQRLEGTVRQPGGSAITWRTVLSFVILIVAIIRLIVRLSR